MPKAKEFTVTIEDKPGALGKCFLALAERGVNILAFQSYVEEGESLARLWWTIRPRPMRCWADCA